MPNPQPPQAPQPDFAAAMAQMAQSLTMLAQSQTTQNQAFAQLAQNQAQFQQYVQSQAQPQLTVAPDPAMQQIAAQFVQQATVMADIQKIAGAPSTSGRFRTRGGCLNSKKGGALGCS